MIVKTGKRSEDMHEKRFQAAFMITPQLFSGYDKDYDEIGPFDSRRQSHLIELARAAYLFRSR
jgi:hypothetical protein